MMTPPRKLRRKNRPSPAADEWTLPTDLLLEIVARSDPATFVSCAAACKLLRRDILDPSFIRRVTRHGGAVPPCVLASLRSRSVRGRDRDREPLISSVHPATRAASSFVDGNLAPYMLRRGFDILCRYAPLTSRGGLVVLRRRFRNIQKIGMCKRWPALCVFNPMTGDCTYLSRPLRLRSYEYDYKTNVLLTEADGIGCSFLLLVTYLYLCHRTGAVRFSVQAAKPSEDGVTSWGPAASAEITHLNLPTGTIQDKYEPVVLHGGIIHWLLTYGDEVLTYDVCTERLGKVELPPTNCEGRRRLLGKSPDGRLRLLTVKRFMVSVWLQLSDSWVKEAAVSVGPQLRSLNPNTSPSLMLVLFECSTERSGAVLLRGYRKGKRRRRGPLIVLDLETKEMRMQKSCSSLYPSLFEVDLSLRLQAMKIFF